LRAPDHTGGAYSTPPDSLAGLRGLLLSRGVRRGGEGREKGEERMVGEVEGRGKWFSRSEPFFGAKYLTNGYRYGHCYYRR